MPHPNKLQLVRRIRSFFHTSSTHLQVLRVSGAPIVPIGFLLSPDKLLRLGELHKVDEADAVDD